MNPASEPLKFKVADIVDRGGLAVRLSVPGDYLLREPLAEAAPGGPLAVTLEFAVGADSVLLEGTFNGTWRLGCARCLAEHAVGYEGTLVETYEATVSEIDLSDDLRQAALLELPKRSLCRPDCRGLCPACGRNLNESACACAPQKTSGFDALKKLKEH